MCKTRMVMKKWRKEENNMNMPSSYFKLKENIGEANTHTFRQT